MSECHEQKKRAIYNETEERKRMKKINEHKHISTKRIFFSFFFITILYLIFIYALYRMSNRFLETRE